MISISKERLESLEKLERELPMLIENAILDYKKNKLKKLHENDKNNPQSVNIRVKRYVEKHKDEINARRREKRKQKKEQLSDVATEVVENTTLAESSINELTTS